MFQQNGAGQRTRRFIYFLFRNDQTKRIQSVRFSSDIVEDPFWVAVDAIFVKTAYTQSDVKVEASSFCDLRKGKGPQSE